MFLDDQIIQTVIDNKEADPRVIVDKILKLCQNKMSEYLHEDMNDANIVPATKRVCNAWNSAAGKLEDMGYPYLKKNGFKNYLLSIPEFTEILIPLGFDKLKN
jgi:hypothetical protein